MNIPNDEIDRSPPIMKLLTAASFFKAAQHLESAVRDGSLKLNHQIQPIYFLYRHALELLLKAYLRSAGMTEKQLSGRELGHDLEKLYDLEQFNRLPQSGEQRKLTRQVVALLAGADQGHALRYPQVGIYQLPDTGAVKQVMNDLLAVIRPLCQPKG